MNETKQTPTPGPWRLCGRFNPTVEKADETNRICEMLDHAPEDYANARLIAAAPELLAFVEMIANGGLDSLIEGESHATIEAEARALLAKATGGAA